NTESGTYFAFNVHGFNTTTNVPFPSDDTPVGPSPSAPFVKLPYLAFNYLGQLVDDRNQPTGYNEFIPIAAGSVHFQRNPTNGIGLQSMPSVVENPTGNTTNAFNVVSIDWLTGRARLERQQIQ